jgi:hypothetical protein
MAVILLRPRNIDIVLGAAALALSWMGLRASGNGESGAETQVRLDQFHQGPETIEQHTNKGKNHAGKINRKT